MSTAPYEEAFRELEETFRERFVPEREEQGAPARLVPSSAEELGLVMEVAERYGLRLMLRGGATTPGPASSTDGLLLDLGLMRDVALTKGGELRVQPGIPWVELEDYLRHQGKSLRVYPTSAPRSTVGGWLARDGLGIGSYEFGWLSDNVVSVEVVLPGGERRELRGDDLALVLGAEGTTGIIAGATLLLREAEHDVPFAASFDDTESLARTIRGICRAGLPLWHLGFVDPARAHAVGLHERYVLFGAYHAGANVETALEEAFSEHGGQALPLADAYRAWGGRFFPAGLSGETPSPGNALVPDSGLSEILHQLEHEAVAFAVQGTITAEGDALLLAFRAGDGRLESFGPDDAENLLRLARQAGGGEYVAGLHRYQGNPRYDALRRFKSEVDPKGVLGPIA